MLVHRWRIVSEKMQILGTLASGKLSMSGGISRDLPPVHTGVFLYVIQESSVEFCLKLVRVLDASKVPRGRKKGEIFEYRLDRKKSGVLGPVFRQDYKKLFVRYSRQIVRHNTEPAFRQDYKELFVRYSRQIVQNNAHSTLSRQKGQSRLRPVLKAKP